MMMMSKILIVTKSFSVCTGIDFHSEGEAWAKVFFHEEKRNMDEKKRLFIWNRNCKNLHPVMVQKEFQRSSSFTIDENDYEKDFF